MLRRILLVLLTALLGLTGWAGAAGSAYAGGPTSVLLVNTDRARVHALYLTDAAYDRLAAAVGDADGASTPPPGVAEGVKDQVKLTWLIHDVTVWRLDRVMLTRNDGIWIETALKLPEDDDTARWHRAHDDQALTALLSAAGLLGNRASRQVTPQRQQRRPWLTARPRPRRTPLPDGRSWASWQPGSAGWWSAHWVP